MNVWMFNEGIPFLHWNANLLQNDSTTPTNFATFNDCVHLRTWFPLDHLVTSYSRWWISHLLSFISLFQWLIKAWWPYQYFSCQIKIMCLQIFLVTYMICGWKCLVDKDRYWETENSCYRNPVLLQRSYWKISYYGQQNKYPWDQLNILGKSVIEGTMKSIYSQKWANDSPRAARRGRWDIFWKMKI